MQLWAWIAYECIDSRAKIVVFRPLDAEEYKFCGSRVRATPPLLLAIQASKWVRDGARAYLPYVIAEPEVEAKLEDILVVRDFSDVVAKISGLPPDRDVESSQIELMPRT
jgi:hypothetical protein